MRESPKSSKAKSNGQQSKETQQPAAQEHSQEETNRGLNTVGWARKTPEVSLNAFHYQTQGRLKGHTAMSHQHSLQVLLSTLFGQCLRVSPFLGAYKSD